MGSLTYEEFLMDIDYLSSLVTQYEFSVRSEGAKYLCFKDELRVHTKNTNTDTHDDMIRLLHLELDFCQKINILISHF